MKTFKSFLTTLIVVAMVFSSFGVFAADETSGRISFSDVTPGTKVADAVAKLVGYQIINGYEDGTFKPDNTITRAEFAAVIARFRGIGSNLAENATTGFADLDADESSAWARPYVKSAVDAGIINGFDDGTFRAKEPVTYEQAVKMIVCAVGYEPVANSEYNKLSAINSAGLTWSSGYITAANKYGITANAISGAVNAPATRGVVAILTSNAYEVPRLEGTTDINGNISYEQGSGTYGDDQYNTQKKIEGIVVANYYSSLENAESDVQINEIVIEDKDEKQVVYEMTDELRNSINVEELLGQRVIAYYAKDELALVSIEPYKNDITKIEEATITRPLDGNSISYVEDGRNQSISVSNCTFIYNGKAGYIESLEELEPIFANGYIEVNETTSVVKVTSYEVFVVNSYSKNEGNGKIYLKYRTYKGENFYEFPSGGTSSKPEIFVNGTKKAFDSLTLAQYNVINYFESPDVAGPKLRRMYVTTGAKSGKVTSVIDGDRLIELNNNELYLTNDYYNYTPSGSSDVKAPFEMGDSYTYYLDYTGQVAAINYNAAAQGSYEYGYVLGADDDKIKVVRKSGAVQILTMKSKVKFDGANIDSEEVEGALKAVADEKLAGSDMQDGYCQPIKFSLSSGEVNGIDTVAPGEGGNSDLFCANELYTGTDVKPTTSSVKVNGTTYSLSSSTVVLYVPDDREAESEYTVMSPSKAFSVSANRQIEIFGADESARIKTPGLIIVYGMNPTLVLTGSSPYMVVTRTLNGDTVEGYKSSEPSEVSKIVISEERFYTDPEKAWVGYDDIGKGDVIRILESNSQVVAIEMIYDASEATDGLNTGSPDVDSNGLELEDTDGNDLYIYYVEALMKVEDDNKIIVTTEFESTDEEDKLASQKDIKISSTTMYYSYDGNDIISGNSIDVVKDEEGNSSRLIVFITGSSTSPAKAVYVLK